MVNVHAIQPSSVSDKNAITRREFLNYVWGASLALLLAEAGGAAVWFGLPRGIDDGRYRVPLEKIPTAESGVVLYIAESNEVSRFANQFFWLRHVNEGLIAFSGECPKEGCYYKLVSSLNRFICPCCGSSFAMNGQRIRPGIAKRSLDRYEILVYGGFDLRKTPDDGSPISIDGAKDIIVNTRVKILGKAAPFLPET